MNVLYGLTQPDEGEILIDGQPAALRSPKDAIRAGIGMVHQHFMLVPVFTVAENVTLGAGADPRCSACSTGAGHAPRGARAIRALRPACRPGRLRRGPAGRRAAAGRDHQGTAARGQRADPRRADRPFSPRARPRNCSRSCAQLREGGRSIVFISHKLKEVQEIADTVTVIRRGRVVGERPPTASDEELAALMVGRAVQLQVSKARRPARRRRAGVADLHRPERARPGRGGRGVASRSGRARSWASPACRATGRPSCARR